MTLRPSVVRQSSANGRQALAIGRELRETEPGSVQTPHEGDSDTGPRKIRKNSGRRTARRSWKEGAPTAECSGASFAQIEETMATMQVDIQMRVRGEELAAMADALEQPATGPARAEATERKSTRTQLIVELNHRASIRTGRLCRGTSAELGGRTGLDSDARSPRGPHESGTRCWRRG